MDRILTIGYGSRDIKAFVNLLEKYEIKAVCDVRSMPYSQRYEAFNREHIRVTLSAVNVKYLFFGDVLGARPSDQELYEQGKASYSLMEQSTAFQSGIERLEIGMQSFKIALMCAEREPLDCHRAILIARALNRNGISVSHVDSNGCLESHHQLEQRLIRLYGLEQSSLLDDIDDGEAIELAYKKRASEISYDVEAAYRARSSS